MSEIPCAGIRVNRQVAPPPLQTEEEERGGEGVSTKRRGDFPAAGEVAHTLTVAEAAPEGPIAFEVREATSPSSPA